MLIIQQAKKKDKANVFLLAEALAISYVVERKAFEKAFERALNHPREVVFVAKQGNKCIGYCLGSIHTTFYANGDVAWLEELYVSPCYRYFGIGKKLVRAFENWAQHHHVTRITLATRRAEYFYEAIGYEASAIYFKKELLTNNGS